MFRFLFLCIYLQNDRDSGLRRKHFRHPCSDSDMLWRLMNCRIIIITVIKARFPLPEFTVRVDGWPVSITRQHGPCWRVMETGHPSTRAVKLTRVVETELRTSVGCSLTVGTWIANVRYSVHCMFCQCYLGTFILFFFAVCYKSVSSTIMLRTEWWALLTHVCELSHFRCFTPDHENGFLERFTIYRDWSLGQRLTRRMAIANKTCVSGKN